MTALIIFVLGLVLMIGYTVTIYNGLVRNRNEMKLAWSNIDVLLVQRHDERNLAARISAVETAIADHREIYNDAANAQNVRIETFLDAIIAGMFDFAAARLLKLGPLALM